MSILSAELSIIIVDYNGKHYLKQCLDSIADHCSSVSYEIIIVDNNSSNGSQKYLKENYSGGRLSSFAALPYSGRIG